MTNESWRYENTVNADATSFPTLKLDTSNVPREVIGALGMAPFMIHDAQAFP